MESYKIGTYLAIVSIIQFFALLLYGYIEEGGDINAASMYPVVYWIPAIVYNFITGLLIFMIKPQMIRGLSVLLLLPAVVTVVINEATGTKGKELYNAIIAASLIINSGYFFLLIKKKRTTSTNKT